MVEKRVVVVGAGLAGLTCGVELAGAGIDCRLLEAADGVGGRVRTDVVEGFRLDRGFQVLLTAYPEARRMLDYQGLDLRSFFPGAMLRSGGRFQRLADPWRRPVAGVAAALRGTVSITDGLRMARLRARTASPADGPRDRSSDRTSISRLRAEGFSRAIIERFFTPFFGGVFLDPELTTSERQLEFVFRMFASGDIAVPAHGMGEIAGQLAARLPSGSVRTGTGVRRVFDGGIETADGDLYEADAVVVATDGTTAAGLTGVGEAPFWRSVTCLYFAAEGPPFKGPYLVLGADEDGPVNNLCVMSEIAPEYAPDEQALISVTVLGVDSAPDNELEAAVRRQMEGWFGPSAAAWRLLRVYRIENALPDQAPSRVPMRSPRLESGLYVCGDHAADGSINGAMASGRGTARAVLDDLHGRRT